MNIDIIGIVTVIAIFAVIFFPLLIWIPSQIINMKESLGKVSENVGRLDERLKNVEKGVDVWQAEMRYEFVRIYEHIMPKKSASNPISLEQKENLLRKFQAGTISQEEAKELQSILEEEKREAERAGDIVTAIAIGVLLAALAYLIYKLIQEK